MASTLDGELAAIMDGMMSPGAPFETVMVERNGAMVPAFAKAPPSLPALFEAFCRQHGEAEFLIDGELRLTFAEAHALARRLAAGLILRHRVMPGETVGIAARNSANWVIAYMGVLMSGGCVTMLNGWWSGEELAAGIELAGCRIALCDPQRAARLEGHALPARLVVFDHGDPDAGFAEILVAAPGDATLPEPVPDDPATILFTSGSTGTSKGAYCDHRGVVQAAMNFFAQTAMVVTHLAAAGRAPAGQPAILLCLPLFHVSAEVAVLLQSFLIGRKIVFQPKWDARDAMRLIEKERVTNFLGVPLMSHEIATHPERDRYDLSCCLQFAAGGAPRPPEHVSRIREALPHAYPLLGYGLTETNAVGCGNYAENYLAKPESTGPASRPLSEVAIFDETGRPVPAGQSGEVAIRSVANFLGYWKNAEATRAALRPDGFFLTGDLGYLDEDGYLFIVDRKKDIIIRGGENIACLEVEQVLYAHPGVAEACVFGLPDDLYGEVPVAVFHTRPGHELSPDELRGYAAERMAAFKVPVHLWREADPLPRLGTEKIDKRALKARYAEGWSTSKNEE